MDAFFNYIIILSFINQPIWFQEYSEVLYFVDVNTLDAKDSNLQFNKYTSSTSDNFQLLQTISDNVQNIPNTK